MANDEYDNAITDKEMTARFAHLRDLSVEAEPARDDVANALQMLLDIQIDTVDDYFSAGRPAFIIVPSYRDAIVARLRAALAKLDGGAR